MSLLCRLLFHDWTDWGAEYRDEDGVPWQSRQCVDCKIRQNRPCY